MLSFFPSIFFFMSFIIVLFKIIDFDLIINLYFCSLCSKYKTDSWKRRKICTTEIFMKKFFFSQFGIPLKSFSSIKKNGTNIKTYINQLDWNYCNFFVDILSSISNKAFSALWHRCFLCVVVWWFSRWSLYLN